MQIPAVEIIVSFGDDSGGSYVEQTRTAHVMPPPLPGAVMTIMTSIATRSFLFLQSIGVIPAGTEEE
jgi:hypothetical protein